MCSSEGRPAHHASRPQEAADARPRSRCCPAAKRDCARPASAACPSQIHLDVRACGCGAPHRRRGTDPGGARPRGPCPRTRCGCAPGRRRRPGQPFEDERVVGVRRGRGAGDRDAVSVHRDLVLGPPLGPVRRVGPGEVAAALAADRAAVEDRVGVAAQHADQRGMHLRQQPGPRPTCQATPQGRAPGLVLGGDQAAPWCAVAQEAPQRRHDPEGLGRRVPGPRSGCWSQASIAVAVMRELGIQCLCPCPASQTWAAVGRAGRPGLRTGGTRPSSDLQLRPAEVRFEGPSGPGPGIAEGAATRPCRSLLACPAVPGSGHPAEPLTKSMNARNGAGTRRRPG